jgi:uncharacterized protein YacL
MNCYESAILGTGLLGASFYTSLISKEEINKLRQLFTGDAVNAYDRIVKERSMLYIQGLIFGFLVSYLINYNYGSEFDNSFHKATLYILIILLVAVSYYLIMPKSDYMLNYIKTEEQSKAWLSMYRTMRSRYMTGFAIGALAAIPLARSLC